MIEFLILFKVFVIWVVPFQDMQSISKAHPPYEAAPSINQSMQDILLNYPNIILYWGEKIQMQIVIPELFQKVVQARFVTILRSTSF